MLKLLLRRARAQWPLLLSLLVVLSIGATLLGTCALLVTRTSERAVEVAAARATPSDAEVKAFAVTIAAKDAKSVATDTRSVLAASTAPFTSTVTSQASSLMRELSENSEGYLSGIEGLPEVAGLVAGRWPAATRSPMEAVVFDSTARLLKLTVGQRVRLGHEMARDPAGPVDVVVVGVVRPLPDAGWDRDPLGGAGFDPSPSDSAFGRQVQAYGPFIVTLGDLLNSGSALDRLEVTARPDLSAPTSRDLDRMTTALLGADRKLAGTLGERVRIERVSSPLPQTLLDARGQQELTAGSVLALALIRIVLTAIALALAGRLATGVRAEESGLLTALGTSRGQFAAVAVAEAGALAALAVALAIPASSVLHAALTHLPPLSGAGLATPRTVTVAQVLAILVGVLALTILQVGLAIRPAGNPGDRRSRRELLARSGADVLLVGLAGVGWWQLSAQPAGADTRADTVRVLAPALLLTAGVAVALRLLPPALRGAESLAGRTRGLVLPLAAFQAARRPQAVAAGLLIGLGCAAATFGVAFDSTWHASQHDQADLAVGTDLAITLGESPVAGQSAVIQAATGAAAISPVAERNVAVGQWLGQVGSAPQLIAIDTRQAPALLRGRIGDLGTGLAPASPVTGLALPKGSAPVVTGTWAGGVAVSVTPRLLLQDDAGLRTSCTGPLVPLDGRPHPVPDCVPIEGLRLIAVALPFSGEADTSPVSSVDVTVTLPGVTGSGPDWAARSATESGQIDAPKVVTSPGRLRMTASVKFQDPADLSRILVATAFPNPEAVPVAISSRLARDVGAHPGSKLSIAFGGAPIDMVVTSVVPAVPSAPAAPAALADLDALTRAMAAHGEFDSQVTGWWAGRPRADAAARITGLHLGTVTTRAGETERLTGSPLRASLPAVLRVLVVAAVVLLLGGVVLHVTCDVQIRALEVARLRGLGMSRRDIRAGLLGEHAAVLLPLLLAGALIGALATWVIAPLLIRSDTGATPIPPADPHWPWAAESALIGLLVVGTGLAVTAVVTVQARRADAEHLRVTS